jgi:hypothetical protein
MTQQPINRCLADKSMDRIDHALGRPLDPRSETYRNHYATDGALADEMAASLFWTEGRRNEGGLRNFYVTQAGCDALAKHLSEIGDPYRAFVVTYAGHPRTVVAINRDKARYSHYLDISDCLPDLDFKDYCRRTTVAAVPR